LAVNILLIEDRPEQQQRVCETLSERGYSVATLSDPDKAMATVAEWSRQFQLVIIEEAMRGRSGLRLLREARSRRNNLPVVIVSRDADWNGYARAMSEGAINYIPHPVDRCELLAAVERALS
jgi:DNA-binding NtrC family response regulator